KHAVSKAVPLVMQSSALAKSLSAFLIQPCATSPLFFIKNFAFAHRGGFNGETGGGPLLNLFGCANENLFIHNKTEVGQRAVDWDRVLRSWLGRFVRDDEQIDIAVGSVSAPGATAEKDRSEERRVGKEGRWWGGGDA